MKMPKNTDKIIQSFLESLFSESLSKVSIANYRSDINHFLFWFARRISLTGVYVETFSDLLPFLKKDTGRSYKASLLQAKLPVSSINRGLSSLRRLSRFLLTRGLLAFDFMEATGNVKAYQKEGQKTLANESFLVEFEKHLTLESSSKNTVKNYVSDVRQFLTWLERKS